MISLCLTQPIHIRIQIRITACTQCVQLHFIILQRKTVIIQCLILHPSISITVNKFWLIHRQSYSVSITCINVTMIILPAFRCHHNDSACTAHSPKCCRRPVFQNLYTLYFHCIQVFQVTGNTIHYNQRTTSHLAPNGQRRFPIIIRILLYSQTRK